MKTKTPVASPPKPTVYPSGDFGFVRGQEAAKRAVTVALAGRHSITLLGQSGTGKSLLRFAADVVFRQVWKDDESQRLRSYELRCVTDLTTENRDELTQTDIHVEVPPVPFHELFGTRAGTDSAQVTEQVTRAKAFEARSNQPIRLSDECLLLMKQAYTELGLSARAALQVVSVARTIANLEESETIQVQHLAEAVNYQLLSRAYFGENSRGNAHLRDAAVDLRDALESAIEDAIPQSPRPNWYDAAVAAVKKSKTGK